MPSSYTIDPARRLVHSVVGETISNAEILTHSRKLAEDPAFHADYDHLVDATALKRVTATPGGVRLAAERSPFSPQSYRAFVSDRPIVVGFVRMFELIHFRSQRIRIFRTLPEAEAWLQRVRKPEEDRAV